MRAFPRRFAVVTALALVACKEAPAPTEVNTRDASAPRTATVDVGALPLEVSVVDQSNSLGTTFGGTIHVFDGSDRAGAKAERAAPMHVIDLAGATAALCTGATGAAPVRPHMLFFNTARTHALLAFVASAHVVVFDAATRAAVTCGRSTAG
jgi:hypothetical protein